MTGRFPRQFGKYVLLKPLAKGGMGEIYLAAGGEVGGFEKLCVIKKVITEKADKTKANRFLDEAKVGLRLSHSALVNTFDVGEVAGEFYIAMELIEGKDLREVWNRCVRTRQRIPLDVALHVVRETARALSYVHNYGDLKLVHRDVAPPNILLAYVGDVKLTDFGLARSVLKQEHTAPGVVFGRAAYLAPEQARGEVADARTDVYTLGIVLWELLTGQQFLQLGGLDPAAALALVRHPRQVPPSARAPWITAVLDQVALKALAPDREKRFQSADEFRQALSAVIADIAPTADSSRVSSFLQGIYAETIADERQERERFLKTEIPTFRAALARGVRFGDGEARSSGAETPEPETKPPADEPSAAMLATDPWSGEGPPADSDPPHLPGMPGSPRRMAADKPEGKRLSGRRSPSSSGVQAIALDGGRAERARGEAKSRRATPGRGAQVLPFGGGGVLTSALRASAAESIAEPITRPAEVAVALVPVADENRRRQRREAALRVVGELAAEDFGATVGSVRSASPALGNASVAKRRPTPPPPVPKDAQARASAGPPSTRDVLGAVALHAPRGEVGPVSPPASPDRSGPPGPSMNLPAAAAASAVPGRPMLGSGMLSRYGSAALDNDPRRQGIRIGFVILIAVGAIVALVKLL